MGAALAERRDESAGARARPTLAECYRHCERVTNASGSSFVAAFWMLPREKRQAMHAVYAFCRLADDIADDPAVRGDRRALLERWRSELDAAYADSAESPVARALGDAARRFALPRETFAELLAGVASDLAGAPIRTSAELHRYCYRVASTVGLTVVRILGYRNPRSLDYAETLGIAVQLTNVLRDVGADARAGRIYLPREELARFGVDPQSLRDGRMTEPLRCLLAAHCEKARILYERAAALLPEDDRTRLRAAEAMGRIYRGLLDELHRRGFPCLGPPLRLSRGRRIAIAAGVWLGVPRLVDTLRGRPTEALLASP